MAGRLGTTLEIMPLGSKDDAGNLVAGRLGMTLET